MRCTLSLYTAMFSFLIHSRTAFQKRANAVFFLKYIYIKDKNKTNRVVPCVRLS